MDFNGDVVSIAAQQFWLSWAGTAGVHSDAPRSLVTKRKAVTFGRVHAEEPWAA